jgi:hypothetical protein
MELELEPAQRPEVVDAIARALAGAVAEPDPWWQAGLEEALRGDRPAPEHPGSGARVVEP